MTSCVLQVGRQNGRRDRMGGEGRGRKVGALTRANDQSNVHSARENKREIVVL